ncbi:hypothetical protein LHU53_07460 [Rhodoferax sp. U2-2l]|uniref:hypothetical protein n=1 Tax=Rhodoferax sp. U2-2l TaxID=2884000 RepID=UPI001D0B2E2E|nr:hypothetical protein [Rhodoferax sp. U2-2l]MCB8746743.1 hypothetical protein [Rhodoferax sp. U2-2l]
MTIFAIAGGILSTLMVYVVMKVSQFGQNQAMSDQLLKVETERATAKKTMLGYTHYAKCLEASRQTAADALRSPVVILTREYTQVELLNRDTYHLQADVTVVVKYAVEFAFALDVSPAGLALSELANGVSLKVTRPTLAGEPKVKTLSSQVIGHADLRDKSGVLADLQAQFVQLARGYGTAMSTEEAVRNLCKLKALEAARDALAAQPGVRHVPAVFAELR